MGAGQGRQRAHPHTWLHGCLVLSTAHRPAWLCAWLRTSAHHPAPPPPPQTTPSPLPPATWRQLGTLAEFRGEWAAAQRLYGEAYAYVPQVTLARVHGGRQHSDCLHACLAAHR